MTSAAIELAIGWPQHDERTLGDLIDRLDALGPDYQSQVWDAVERWLVTETDEERRGHTTRTHSRWDDDTSRP